MTNTRNEVTFSHADEDDTVWLSPHVFLVPIPERCFNCGIPTDRIDISWGAAFCDSPECNASINADLMRAAASEGGYEF